MPKLAGSIPRTALSYITETAVPGSHARQARSAHAQGPHSGEPERPGQTLKQQQPHSEARGALETGRVGRDRDLNIVGTNDRGKARLDLDTKA